MKAVNFFLYFLVLVAMSFLHSCSDASDLNSNQPPRAVFSFAPENADTSIIIMFDASESYDGEDSKENLLFMWDFEGVSSWTDPVNDPSAFYKYSQSGNYNVGLKVIDTEGWSDKVRKNVIVKDSV